MINSLFFFSNIVYNIYLNKNYFSNISDIMDKAIENPSKAVKGCIISMA